MSKSSRLAVILIVSFVVMCSLIVRLYINGRDDPRLSAIQKNQIGNWIKDDANALAKSDRERLSDLLRGYQQETQHQILVLIVPTIGNESIENFSLRAFNEIGIGRKGINDGMLILVAMKERQVRIELGKGMGSFISNADAAEIITRDITPSFSRGDVAGGLERGLVRLMDEGRRFTPKPKWWDQRAILSALPGFEEFYPRAPYLTDIG
jgi:uncharacterized protein